MSHCPARYKVRVNPPQDTAATMGGVNQGKSGITACKWGGKPPQLTTPTHGASPHVRRHWGGKAPPVALVIFQQQKKEKTNRKPSEEPFESHSKVTSPIWQNPKVIRKSLESHFGNLASSESQSKVTRKSLPPPAPPQLLPGTCESLLQPATACYSL